MSTGNLTAMQQAEYDRLISVGLARWAAVGPLWKLDRAPTGADLRALANQLDRAARPLDLSELTEDERQALPADYHRPYFDALGEPHSWICAVCWGDGWTTGWPCEPATRGGITLAQQLGLGVST